MQLSNKNKIWFLTALAIACQNPAKATDWFVTAPVIIGSGHENDRLVINSDIKETNDNQAALKINGSLAGILIYPERSAHTNAGLRSGSSFTPDTASINITESGSITRTVNNYGYIRSGINLEGEIVTGSGSALNIEGTSQSSKAVILESVSLHNSGYIRAANDHAVAINQHGFVDFISIDTGSSIHSAGAVKSAVYIADSGQFGGALSQSISADDSLYYSGNDATAILNVQGQLSSESGSGIKIDGAAHGAIVLSGGQIVGTNTAGEAGIRVNGNYYGTVKNYGGIITNGIVIAGGHSAATNEAVDTPVAAINEGDQSAYISAGVAAKHAELRGGYRVLASGITQAHDNHAIYLNKYSKADYVSVGGTLSTAANEKSAIYVANNAALGDNSGLAAIEVETGGVLTSLEGAAIDVDGHLNGWVTVNGGTLSTGSTDSDHNYAIDFSDADSRLQFIQAQGTSLTQGKIAGSTQANDYMEVRAGSIDSEIISGVEYMQVSGGSVESTAISGLMSMQVLGGTVDSGSITGSGQMLMDVSGGSVITDSITGLEQMQVATGAHVHIMGNFTAPETTTVRVMDGYNRNNALITVDQSLSADSSGSHFIIHPNSAEAFHDMVEKQYVTVIDYNPSVTSNLSGDFSTKANAAFVREDSVLFDLTQEFTDNGHYKIHIQPRPLENIVSNIDVTGQEEELLMNALLAATTEGSVHPDKQQALLDSLQEGTIQELVDGMEPVNPADRQGLMAVQQIVHQRLQLVTGMGFGDNYFNYDGDAFYEDIYDAHHGASSGSGFSFMNGAGWGQFIYGNSRHKGVDGSNGFTGTMSGFVLGADTELTNTFRIGGAGSWTRNKLTSENHSSITVNSYMATLYSHWYNDGWYTDAIFSAGKGESNTSQLLLRDPITGNYKSGTLGVRLVTGHKFGLGALDISPQLEFHYGHMTFDAYKEQGDTGHEKKIDIKDYQVMEFGLGFRLSLPTEEGYSIRPEISMMGYYDSKKTGTEIEATYLVGGDSFAVTGPSRDQLRLQSGMALSIDLMERWTIDATYNFNWSKNFLSNNFSAKARYEF